LITPFSGAGMQCMCCRTPAIRFSFAYTGGSAARLFGPAKRMPLGTYPTWEPALNCAPTGAMIFLLCLPSPPCWTRLHPFGPSAPLAFNTPQGILLWASRAAHWSLRNASFKSSRRSEMLSWALGIAW